jgi:hypothetical protein
MPAPASEGDDDVEGEAEGNGEARAGPDAATDASIRGGAPPEHARPRPRPRPHPRPAYWGAQTRASTAVDSTNEA